MSLFGSLMGDFDDDLGFMGNHMNAMNMQMRSMNRLMNSLMPDPFNMLAPFDAGFQQNALMERGQPGAGMSLFPGFPAMPNMNRLLSPDLSNMANNGAAYCSSSVVTMSSGPDGRPQYYQATSSTKTGPGGVRETRKTVQDSRSGLKKMAIGHHIGDRAHIIEKEQDLRSGQLEERQEFINLEEEQAEQFDREFTNRVTRGVVPPPQRAIRGGGAHTYQHPTSTLTIEPLDDSDDEAAEERPQTNHRYMPALPAPPSNATSNLHQNSAKTSTTKAATTTTANSGVTVDATTRQLQQNEINSSNNNYLNSTPRRAYHYRSHLASPRRPIRTPASSPLATAPTLTTTSSITATSPSATTTTAAANNHLHHPYNNAAAASRRRKSNQKQQQQQQQDFQLQGVQIPTTKSDNSAAKQSRHH